MVVNTGEGVVHLVSLTDGSIREVYRHPDGYREYGDEGRGAVVRFTAAGRLLVAVCVMSEENRRWRYVEKVLDTRGGRVVWETAPSPDCATARVLSPDGRTLYTGHQDGTVLVWPVG